ncbi:MAG: phage tail protein I [Synergistaceae bacterium]|nr:phage tail protein I [Synergistaceae bacterium]
MAKIIHDLSLLDIAPPSISNDKTVKSIITAINPELKSVSEAISDAFIISRINELPERVIDLLAWQWHVDFYEPDLDLAIKRALVLASIKYHKKKGTKYAIKTALEALGFVPTIKEWFETDMGTAPHTFSITGHYKDDEINVDFLGEDTEEILKRVVEITKPVRSSLIYLLVAPTPIDLSEHICCWDVCNWEHFKSKEYNWGLLIPETPLFDDDVVFKRDFERELFTIHDTAFWDFNTWGGIPVRNLQIGSCSENAIIASLEWGEGENALLYPNLWDYSKWDYAATFSRIFGSVSSRIFDLDFNLDDNLQFYHSIVEHKILYDLRPHWDNQTWLEHDKWLDDFSKNIEQSFNYYRSLEADLSSKIYPKWSNNTTWKNSNKTWAYAEQNCSWNIKSWEEN